MNVEKALRQFVRAQFSARVKKVDGEFQSTVKGKTSRVLIQNPATVEEMLREQCGKVVEEKGAALTFKYKTGRGKEVAMVTLTTQKEGGGVLKIDGMDFAADAE